MRITQEFLNFDDSALCIKIDLVKARVCWSAGARYFASRPYRHRISVHAT